MREDLDSTLESKHESSDSLLGIIEIAENINIDAMVRNVVRLPHSPKMGEIPMLLLVHHSHSFARHQLMISIESSLNNRSQG